MKIDRRHRAEAAILPEPAIYAIPVLDRFLIHAPLHQCGASVNRAALANLCSGMTQGSRGALGRLGQMMQRPVHPPDANLRRAFQPPFLGLIPTRKCNLACRYCRFGVSGASEERMDPRLAVEVINWYVRRVRRSGRRVLEVHFFGGEPTAEWEIIEVAVHCARAAAFRRGLIPRFEICTNGMMSTSRLQFLGDYFDTVVLSLDGDREAHDRCRPRRTGEGSFDQVMSAAATLARSNTALCLRMCVSANNVERLPEIARRLGAQLRPAAINFEPLQKNLEIETTDTPPEPYMFARQFLRAREILRRRSIGAVYAADWHEGPRRSFCPVGRDGMIISPNGRIHSCYLLEGDWQSRGMDLCLGEITDHVTIRREAIQNTRRLVMEKPRCRECFCRWSCAGGCHVNRTYPGCSPAYDDFCRQTRLITACTLLGRLGEHRLAMQLMNNLSAQQVLAERRGDGIGVD